MGRVLTLSPSLFLSLSLSLTLSFSHSLSPSLFLSLQVVKIWERHEPAMGRVLTNIETPADINAFACVADRRGDARL
jgi:hypothetical protein